MADKTTLRPGGAVADEDTGIAALKLQLGDVMHVLHEVGESTALRGQILTCLEQTVDDSTRGVSEMESILDIMTREITPPENEFAELGSSCEAIVNEQDEMDEQVCKNEEALSATQHILEDVDADLYQQYDNLKTDVRRHRVEAAYLLNKLSVCHKAILVRLDDYVKSDSRTAEETNKVEKLKKAIDLSVRYRTSTDEVGDLELEVSNVERVLRDSYTEVEAKLAQIEDLKSDLSGTRDTFGESAGCCLKSSSCCSDLNQKKAPKGQLDSHEWYEKYDPCVHVGGRMLHKCPKITNIPLQIERNEDGDGGQGEMTQDGKKYPEKEQGGVERPEVGGEGKVHACHWDSAPIEGGTLYQVALEMDRVYVVNEKKYRQESEASSRKTVMPCTEGDGTEDAIKTQENLAHLGHLARLGHISPHLGRESKSSVMVTTSKPKLRTANSIRSFHS